MAAPKQPMTDNLSGEDFDDVYRKANTDDAKTETAEAERIRKAGPDVKGNFAESAEEFPPVYQTEWDDDREVLFMKAIMTRYRCKVHEIECKYTKTWRFIYVRGREIFKDRTVPPRGLVIKPR